MNEAVAFVRYLIDKGLIKTSLHPDNFSYVYRDFEKYQLLKEQEEQVQKIKSIFKMQKDLGAK